MLLRCDGGGQGDGDLAADGGGEFADFGVARSDGSVELFPCGFALLEDEEILGAVVSAQGFFVVAQWTAAAGVAQGGLGTGITLACEDGADNGLSADSINVAEDVLEFEVHLPADF